MKERNNRQNNIDAQNVTNVFELINMHCELAVIATNALALYLSTSNKAAAEQVRDTEVESQQRRSDSLAILRKKFPSSPLRGQTHLAIKSIVEIVHYTHTTIREMDILRVGKDEHLEQLGALIKTGTRSLCDGYAQLTGGVTDVDEKVETTRQIEQDAEETYRSALSNLFNPGSFIEFLDAVELDSHTKFLGHYLQEKADHNAAAAKSLAYVANIFRRREILRHLSNTADRVLHAGNVLDEFSWLVEAVAIREQGNVG